MSYILVWDIETTAVEGEICELGCSRVEVGSGKALDWWSEFVLYDGEMDVQALATHHIAPQRIRKYGMPFASALHMMPTSGDVVANCAHNAAFEMSYLKGRAPIFDLPWICTMKCAMTLMPDLPSFSNQVVRYSIGTCGPEDAAADPPHRAGPDAYVTAHTLRHFLQTTSVERLIEISANPVRLKRISFGKHVGTEFDKLPRDYLSWIVKQQDMDPNVLHSARCVLEGSR